MANFQEIIKNKLNDFPVGVWVPYYREQFSKEWLQKIYQCGVNFIPTNSPEEQELELIRKSGLKCIVSDDQVVYANVKTVYDIRSRLTQYMDREEVMGLFIWDEPSPLMMRICGTINDEVQHIAPHLFGFINLHPSYSDCQKQRDGLSYEEYLEFFVNTAHPKFICFDHYPFLDGKITEDYFYNLQCIRNCCNTHGLDFWTFIQTCSFGNNITPTDAQIKWHAYTNLAYGAKGLIYFTYATVTHDPDPNFGPALVDLKGDPTSRYYAAADINVYVRSIGKKLLSLSHRGVLFFNYPQESTAEEGFASIEKIEGGPVLAGCFEDENKDKYLFLVNLNQNAEEEFTLVFKGKNGKPQQKICLGAGEGRLICVTI